MVYSTMMVLVLLQLFLFGSVENTRRRGYSVDHGGSRYAVSFFFVVSVALGDLFFCLHGQVALAVLCLFLWSGGSYCLVIFWFCQEDLDSKFVFVGHKAIGELFFIVR